MFSEASKPGSQLSLKNKNSFKNSLINNNKCINIKIFKKVEMEKVMNFELLSDIERFNNHPLKNNPFLYVTNQIVNINKKNIINKVDKDIINSNNNDNIVITNLKTERKKETKEVYIQTEESKLKKNHINFTVNGKKKSFLCCF